MAHERVAAGEGRVLMIILELADYWPRQRNLLGGREVELGTGHAVALPWLTALDAPVRVLQLTGAVIDENGKAVRIGAEGMLVRRTNLLAGSIGAQRLVTEEDVEQLRTMRREDMPGQPFVWQIALRNLGAGLTGGLLVLR